mmetsp:Transcript_751/g.2364  ORF Transcript_751/g.2364 Transcript_751/m.2364 type:complete len:503 (-) Transcript_751:398-1906(-)
MHRPVVVRCAVPQEALEARTQLGDELRIRIPHRSQDEINKVALQHPTLLDIVELELHEGRGRRAARRLRLGLLQELLADAALPIGRRRPRQALRRQVSRVQADIQPKLPLLGVAVLLVRGLLAIALAHDVFADVPMLGHVRAEDALDHDPPQFLLLLLTQAGSYHRPLAPHQVARKIGVVVLEDGGVVISDGQLVRAIHQEAVRVARVVQVVAQRGDEQTEYVQVPKPRVDRGSVHLVVAGLEHGKAMKPIVERIVPVAAHRGPSPMPQGVLLYIAILDQIRVLHDPRDQGDQVLRVVIQGTELHRPQLRRQLVVDTRARQRRPRRNGSVAALVLVLKFAAPGSRDGSPREPSRGLFLGGPRRRARSDVVLRTQPGVVVVRGDDRQRLGRVPGAGLERAPTLPVERVADHHRDFAQLVLVVGSEGPALLIKDLDDSDGAFVVHHVLDREAQHRPNDVAGGLLDRAVEALVGVHVGEVQQHSLAGRLPDDSPIPRHPEGLDVR